MPSKVLIFSILGIILQYGLVVLLYYFLFQVLRTIYRDLKTVPEEGRFFPSAPAAASEPQEKAKLVVVETGTIQLAQPVYQLGETFTIGRGEANDIVVNDTFVSHEHACISQYKHGFWLTDLNSTNGTYINHNRVTDEVLLKNGDLLRIGAVTFRFER
ncbi:MAG TPA: FHA domain-containing protein [Selenomonadales bacterium]|nr:FHA domain-containing protein [Selenomonadales bacterium]